ncbi:MAG: VOC family protein [Woeseiaceae bacterium]|nr:VOC family protein [Woeseiaceae bacterium]
MTNAIDYDGGLTLSVSISNLDESIAWYEETLGFKLIYRMDEMGWCELSTGVDKVNVGLSVTEERSKGGAVPTFGVKDIESARSALETKNVKLDGDIMTIPDMVRLQTFYDPDGNALMFYEDLGDG